MTKLAKNTVMNGSFSLTKDEKGLQAILKTKAQAIMLGSVTPEARSANPAPNWYDGGSYGMNSFGMPNLGIDGYKDTGILPKIKKAADKHGKVFVVNIAGFSYEDYEKLAIFCEEEGVDVVEANFGCPNTEAGHIVSFDEDTMRKSISAIMEATKNIELLVKVSPYTNPNELKSMASLFAELHEKHPRFTGVVTMNTFPNAYMTELGKDVIGSGMAGMSGKAVMPFALGQVKQFRQHLPDSMIVIGVGGISSKADAQLFFDAGAHGVQVVTHLMQNGFAAIDEVVS